jgi:signal transduction histidine kinase
VLRHGDGGVDIEILDDGAGPSASAGRGGMGITGIRERAEVTGGHAVVGPRPGGGFRVAASWPGRT